MRNQHTSIIPINQTFYNKKRNEILKDIKKLFNNTIFREYEKKHDAYSDSKQYTSEFTFKNTEANIRVECIVFVCLCGAGGRGERVPARSLVYKICTVDQEYIL